MVVVYCTQHLSKQPRKTTMKVSITKAQAKALEAANLDIECAQIDHQYPNGETVILDSVEIYDLDGSDFLVAYTLNKDGSLSFNCAPNSIEDLPAMIKSTRELTAVCKYVASVA